MIALWFGEGDLATEGFIRDAAKQALDDGDTFYTHTRGRQDLRDALKRYLDALYGIDLDPDRITVPGATMLGLTIAAQMVLGTGDHAIIVGPAWPEHRRHVPHHRGRGGIRTPAGGGHRVVS